MSFNILEKPSLKSMNRSEGSIYSTFVWRFTNPVENPSFKDFILEPFDAGYMITCILFVILGSCGMFLNGRAVYLFCRCKTIKSRYNFIILNLIVTDFLISSVGVFLDNVGSSLRGRILAKGFCQFEGFFYMLTGMASLYSTVALSLARLVIVKYKDDSGLQNSKFSEKTASVLTIIWFLALAISIPPLLGFGKYGQNMVAVSCLPSWSNDEPLTKAYIWYICVAGAFIPSVIMIAANMIVLYILKKRHDESQNDDEHQPFWKQYREKQIIVMSLAFLICWAPFAWIYIVKLLGMRDIDSRTIYDMLPLLCVKLGCTVINPIVYVFEKKKFDKHYGSSTRQLVQDVNQTESMIQMSNGVTTKRRSSV